MKQIVAPQFYRDKEEMILFAQYHAYRKQKARFGLRFAYSKVHSVNTSLTLIYV